MFADAREPAHGPAQPLPASRSKATCELAAGEGILDIWLEDAGGSRLPYSDNDSNRDAILRRVTST